MKVKIADIKVKERFRGDYGDIESLATSMNRYGLLHPIVVDKELNLIAGERRLKAAIELGWEEIEVKYLDDVDELTKKEIELEENIRRKDFAWPEEIKAKAELDRIKRAIYGGALQGRAGGWTLKNTADALGESTGGVSQDIQLAEAINDFPELAKEKTKNAAWKKYHRIKQRLMVDELTARMEVKVETENIILGDARVVLDTFQPGTFDLIVTDPPYGVDIDDFGVVKEAHGDTYKDDAFSAMELCRTVFEKMFRVLKDGSNAYVFFAMMHYEEVKKMLEEAGFVVDPTPLVWNKQSQTAPPTTPYKFTYAYEPIFFCTKGTKVLNGYVANVLTYSRVPPSHKIHPSEKPVSLIKKLIEVSTLPGQLVLDPFGGSCVVARAALECKRKCVCIEVDKTYHNAAMLKLKDLIDELGGIDAGKGSGKEGK
jgi:DNA modification methylase